LGIQYITHTPLFVLPLISNLTPSFQWYISGDVYTPVICDATPAKEEQQPFPVIVFSHGLTGCRTSYSAICSELSSHGFVVAAIEHRYINM
jgi:predicted dienelactone hydrolase